MSRLLLCTDMDRTLIPNGKQPESEGARRRFAAFVNREDITLAYVSGRHRQLIEEAIADYRLPTPDFAIADVGSTIYRVEQDTWQPWPTWSAEIDTDWQGLTREQLHALLAPIAGLRPQEAEKQGQHKLSYYLTLTVNKDEIVGSIKARLQTGKVNANVIWSVDEAAGVGLIDILPASANKLHAITFLMRQLRLAESEVIFAGDSGNDLDVLLSSIPSVLVANGDDEVRAAVKDTSPDRLYLAHGAIPGMNGNYSAGILEGVGHYHPELLPLIQELNL